MCKCQPSGGWDKQDVPTRQMSEICVCSLHGPALGMSCRTHYIIYQDCICQETVQHLYISVLLHSGVRLATGPDWQACIVNQLNWMELYTHHIHEQMISLRNFSSTIIILLICVLNVISYFPLLFIFICCHLCIFLMFLCCMYQWSYSFWSCIVIIRGNKMPTRCNRWFLLQILLLCCCSSPQTGHITLSSTPYRQLENQSTKYHRQRPSV